MYQNHDKSLMRPEEFAALGTDMVAYMREISGEEISEAFPQSIELDDRRKYWALFAANGTPLMIADQPQDLLNGAFYNNLHAILPN